ncbi:MAG: glycosyltransferase [Chitinophagaceae bacterium]|jgi:glycosyltransferase involved in cell wall biosynthesis|nr:glycosyltransferase [Chitinophagaceae bacterium]
MILIDAIYIDNGVGTKVLLDYLITNLEKTEKHVYYLLDERLKGNIQSIKPTNVLKFQKSDFSKRINFYLQHKSDFSTVLCFANIPPVIRLTAKVYTYFHHPLYLERPPGLPIFYTGILYLKRFILNILKKNSDYWVVQTDLIKEKLSSKYQISNRKILLLPFYVNLKGEINQERLKGQYIYVSNGVPHKNHIRLIEAFSNFYKKYRQGKLILTVSEKFNNIQKLILLKQQQGVPIENIGFLPQSLLRKYYLQSEFLIFPSLAESFGMGLVEAIEHGCKVIGADLPYIYEVCEPSLTFNPLSVDEIADSFRISFFEEMKPSKIKISNKIEELIMLLS